jgi:putative ABC transport system substrate-binding protein
MKAVTLPGRRLALAVLAAVPFASLAQPAAGRKRVAVLDNGNEEDARKYWAGMLKALQGRGWKEGENIEVIYGTCGRVTQSDPAPWERLPQVARSLAGRSPDAFVTTGTQNTRAAAGATRTIPIVASLADPVGSGFAASLARPGGNVTGLSGALGEVAGKSIEMMRALVPKLARLAVFHWREGNYTEVAGFVLKAARDAGIEAVGVPLTLPPTRIFGAVPEQRSRGVNAAYYSSGTWTEHAGALAAAAIRARLPLWSPFEELAEAGLLGSLASSGNDDEDLAATLDRILRGANPAELPIQYPQRFRLVINQRTAVALGLKIPSDVLLRADRVIE